MPEEISVNVKQDFVGTVIANTLLFTTENNKGTFYPMEVWFSVHQMSGLKSVPAVSIGISPVNYNDIVPVTSLTNLNNVEEVLKINLGDNVKGIPKNTSVYIRVSEAAVATTFLCRVHFVGHYFK
jgi:hypothetical protein